LLEGSLKSPSCFADHAICRPWPGTIKQAKRRAVERGVLVGLAADQERIKTKE
jgi:hypothetical protein